MLSKDRELNIKRSFNRFLRERLGANYYINYSTPGDEVLQSRIMTKTPSDYWKWIDIHWLRVGPGIFSVSTLQINCNTIIAKDQYRVELDKMADEVQEELNVDKIDLFDFSDELNPVVTGNVLIPRFRGSRPLPEAAGDTVNVKALEFNLYVWRESVLP